MHRGRSPSVPRFRREQGKIPQRKTGIKVIFNENVGKGTKTGDKRDTTPKDKVVREKKIRNETFHRDYSIMTSELPHIYKVVSFTGRLNNIYILIKGKNKHI